METINKYVLQNVLHCCKPTYSFLILVSFCLPSVAGNTLEYANHFQTDSVFTSALDD